MLASLLASFHSQLYEQGQCFAMIRGFITVVIVLVLTHMYTGYTDDFVISDFAPFWHIWDEPIGKRGVMIARICIQVLEFSSLGRFHLASDLVSCIMVCLKLRNHVFCINLFLRRVETVFMPQNYQNVRVLHT